MIKGRLVSSLLLLGVALGGFFDGIVLHQILGWHHLICRTETCRPDSVDALLAQTSEDGWFHLAMWMLTVFGVFLLARNARPYSLRQISGSLLAGWGAFNLVEGILDHQILGLHHVLPKSPHSLLYDLLFLASGVLGIFTGRLIAGAETDRHLGTI